MAAYVWLSAQGAAPVYVLRALLTNGMSPNFTRAFDGSMAPLPRVPALEKDAEPVYLVDVPPKILTMMLSILAHPQLEYHYSVDKSGGIDSIVRREYLRYYGLYSLRRKFEDADEAEKRIEKKARLEEDKVFDAACLELYKMLERGHPHWSKQFERYGEVHADFIITYNQAKFLSDCMTINGNQETIGWYFFKGTGKYSRFTDIARGQHENVHVSWSSLWDHTLSVGTRKVEHWPAVERVNEVDAQNYEVVRVRFAYFKL